MIVTPLCAFCKHCNLPEAATCTAFPDGIPPAILIDGYDHRKPYPGDHDIQFVPLEDAVLFRNEHDPIRKAS